MIRTILFLVLLLILVTLYKTMSTETIVQYIPIGDSYTIGEGVSGSERWPNLLAAHLARDGKTTEIIINPARTGWTSEQALEGEVLFVEREHPNLVTILIGVNDIVQGVPAEKFRRNLREIIGRTTNAIPKSGTLVLITIPNFTLTPAGKSFGNTATIQQKLSEFNDIIRKEATERGLPLADIYKVSVKIGEDPKYTAEDGLHPSPLAYIEWEREIYRAVVGK